MVKKSFTRREMVGQAIYQIRDYFAMYSNIHSDFYADMRMLDMSLELVRSLFSLCIVNYDKFDLLYHIVKRKFVNL